MTCMLCRQHSRDGSEGDAQWMPVELTEEETLQVCKICSHDTTLSSCDALYYTFKLWCDALYCTFKLLCNAMHNTCKLCNLVHRVVCYIISPYCCHQFFLYLFSSSILISYSIFVSFSSSHSGVKRQRGGCDPIFEAALEEAPHAWESSAAECLPQVIRSDDKANPKWSRHCRG